MKESIDLNILRSKLIFDKRNRVELIRLCFVILYPFFVHHLQDPVGDGLIGNQVGDDPRAQGTQQGFRLEAVIDDDEANGGLDDLLVSDADDLVGDGAEKVARVVVRTAENHAGNLVMGNIFKQEILVLLVKEAFFFKGLNGPQARHQEVQLVVLAV